MNLTENAISVLQRRYFLPNEGWFELAARVGNHVGENAEQARVFKNLIEDQLFLPNSPCLMGAGTDMPQLFACFVLPVGDSIEEIFDAIKHAALIHKSGGGTGFNFSNLRATNSKVRSTRGVASGPVSFMKIFNSATEQIKQGGRRKGANMGILDIDHPDIWRFISAKWCEGDLNNFNLSVGADYRLFYDADYQPLLKAIAEKAWYNGEPGVLFFDTIQKKAHPSRATMCASNPCVTGDTVVQTTNGPMSIRDLDGQTADVYTMGADGRLTIRNAQVFKTQENARLVKVKTTKGDLICTPDHKIFSRTRREYVQAIDLLQGERLTNLNRGMMNERQVGVGLTGTDKVKEHRFIAAHYFDIDSKDDVHHINGDPMDNRIGNLQVLPHGVHSRLSNLGHPSYHYGRDEYGRYVKAETRKKKEQFRIVSKPGINCYVIDIEYLDYTEPVYDMYVEGTHNFIANGIVVHNCGECPMMPYEPCVLGSINLGLMVDPNGDIDWNLLMWTAEHGAAFLDRCIDTSLYPLPEVEDAAKYYRSIGLGVMGLADMLFQMGIPYSSQEARDVASQVMHEISHSAYCASLERAARLGPAPASVQCGDEHPVRNVARIAIAPTGSLSLIADCSPGIEPVYSLKTVRTVMDGTQLTEYNKHYAEELHKCAGKDRSHLPVRMRYVFETAMEIIPENHIRMQAAIQEHVDQAVSKTVNLPSSATVTDVDKMLRYAYELGCKGVTVYRDGSREEQVMQACSLCD